MAPLITYYYRARDTVGRLQTGYLEAESPGAAASILKQRRLYPISITSGPGEVIKGSFFSRSKKAPLRDLAVFCRQLATILEAGIPLLTGLEILAHQAENRILQEAAVQMAHRLRTGQTMAHSMRQQPQIFPDLVIGMVEAGELSGVLDRALVKAAEHLEREYNLREKIKSAMYYPAVLLIIAFFAAIFLTTYVLPNFTAVLANMQVELPVSTRLLISFSNFLRTSWHLVLAGLLGLIWGAGFLFKLPKIKEKWDASQLHMPIFGSLIKKMVFARFCHALSNLLSAGVPLIRALELTEGATGNSVVTKVIVGARESVRDGLDLTGPLAERQIFPPLITKMIAVGEETGALDQLLEKIAQFYEQEVQTGISRLTSLLEPVLVVTMGVVVGFIVISILLPVLSALSGPPM